MGFREDVQALLAQRGWSQRELAAAAGRPFGERHRGRARLPLLYPKRPAAAVLANVDMIIQASADGPGPSDATLDQIARRLASAYDVSLTAARISVAECLIALPQSGQRMGRSYTAEVTPSGEAPPCCPRMTRKRICHADRP